MQTGNKTLALTATPITVAELKANSAREYNPREWDNKINLFEQHDKNVEWFIVPADKVFSYDRFFVKHTIKEGITFLSQFGYSSSLTSNGFCLIEIAPTDTGDVSIFKTYYLGADGKEAGIANRKEGRAFMAKHSKVLGHIFANDI